MDKVVLVDSGSNGRGFFSTINITLLTLRYCELNELSPIISDSVLGLYGTKINKVRPFSEFFGDLYSEEIPENTRKIEIDWVFNNKLLNFDDEITKNQLRDINRKLLQNLNSDLKAFLDVPPCHSEVKPAISLHFRGCDYLKNTPSLHQPNYKPNEFLDKVHSLISGNKIFIATDDDSFIKLMQKRGYEISFFLDVYRKGPGRGSHIKSFAERFGYQSLTKKLQQKRKAFEVFRDCYWLSKSNTYIGSNSNLMYYSGLLNPIQKQVNLTNI